MTVVPSLNESHLAAVPVWTPHLSSICGNHRLSSAFLLPQRPPFYVREGFRCSLGSGLPDSREQHIAQVMSQTMAYWWRRCRTIIMLLLIWLFVPTFAANFDDCKAKVEEILADPSRNRSTFDILYHGKVRGLKNDDEPPGIMLTLRGCNKICGSSSDPNDVLKAFQILTT